MGIKLDLYFTKDEFIKSINENISDDDIVDMFKECNIIEDNKEEDNKENNKIQGDIKWRF